MASINRLKPGQVVYSIESRKMGNTTIRYRPLFAVRIIEVHSDYVIASYNGNAARRYGLPSIKNWRVNKPKPKTQILGHESY